ncbi:hypothetical protein [Bacillus benzoevorans]|uniref:Uncharacterized protein n=1 Tax=Bacillus benzoevorans TaxID=1456 RepID=A0A7X0HW44_9BACI|nr:hypothetical protein [Bacillus benzoevorans]MBB6446676.1 hypothetical protein [Bacillus benzoevorans]
MRNVKILLLLLIVPWLTIPFVGRESLKRFMPAAIFIALVTKIMDSFGEKRKWWKFYHGIFFNSMDFLILGPYMVASIWILKMTYGKFLTYFISNKILHFLFILFGLQFMGRYKIFSLKKLSNFQYWITHMLRALVLYAFQFIKESLQKPRIRLD